MRQAPEVLPSMFDRRSRSAASLQSRLLSQTACDTRLCADIRQLTNSFLAWFVDVQILHNFPGCVASRSAMAFRCAVARASASISGMMISRVKESPSRSDDAVPAPMLDMGGGGWRAGQTAARLGTGGVPSVCLCVRVGFLCVAPAESPSPTVDNRVLCRSRFSGVVLLLA